MAPRAKRAAPAPADEPAYTIPDAARFLHVPASTLKFWVKGGDYPTRHHGTRHSPPVIKLADPDYLSFRNLAEAFVLRGLRRVRQTSMGDVRGAVKFLAKELEDPHPLVHPDVRFHGKQILLERYGKLISASVPGQIALRETLEAHLERMVWKGETVAQLFPFVGDHVGGPTRSESKIVLIDPAVAYGRPTIGNGIRTLEISQRFDAGDSIQMLADDYDSPVVEIEEAIRYERVGARYEQAA